MASKKKIQAVKGTPDKAEAEQSGKISFTPSSIRQFLGEVQAEFNKVVWPEKKVTIGLTGFVLLLTIVLSIYLGSVDLVLGKIVTYVLR